MNMDFSFPHVKLMESIPAMAHVPAVKRRKLSPPGRAKSQPAFVQTAAHWSLEQDYEQRPRKKKVNGKESTRLPIKTAEGVVEQAPFVEDIPAEGKEKDGSLGSGSEGENDIKKVDRMERPPGELEKPGIPIRQQILQTKEELARIAGLLKEDPEEHIGALKTLAKIAESENATIKKLALATQLAVYKDIIPGYRIRPASEVEMKEKLSKDVRRLRNFEQSIVGGYQVFVRELAQQARARNEADGSEAMMSVRSVAISCACALLDSIPHFNFRSEVLKIIVDRLSNRTVDADFMRCLEALETLFAGDEDGHASLEAVEMLCKMIKARNYQVGENVPNTFLSLRLLSEFSMKASTTKVDKPAEEDFVNGVKARSKKKEFRTKRLKKQMREQKALDKEMKEADAAVSHEDRDRMQGETLKLVFLTYFRILQARVPHLMGAVLEGLAKYSHLINQDFFGDILEALKDLINYADAANHEEDPESDAIVDGEDKKAASTSNATRSSLLCTVTAFALLQGQDASRAASTLHLDLNFFITHLYRTLYPVSLNPDIESHANRRPASVHLNHGGGTEKTKHRVNVQTTAVLLIRSLSAVLLPLQALRSVSPLRIAAFAKQILTASLHLPERSCLAMIGLMNQVTKIHGRRIAGLWNTEERKGDGMWDPFAVRSTAAIPARRRCGKVNC